MKSSVVSYVLSDDGTYPNNEKLPLLVYQSAIALSDRNPAEMENLFERNLWGSSWRGAVYAYHHYHSTAHEVLGVYTGSARVQFGGDAGITLRVNPGDVVIIPAKVAHKKIDASSDFLVVGAYPFGQEWDMNYGKPGERPKAV